MTVYSASFFVGIRFPSSLLRTISMESVYISRQKGCIKRRIEVFNYKSLKEGKLVHPRCPELHEYTHSSRQAFNPLPSQALY